MLRTATSYYAFWICYDQTCYDCKLSYIERHVLTDRVVLTTIKRNIFTPAVYCKTTVKKCKYKKGERRQQCRLFMTFTSLQHQYSLWSAYSNWIFGEEPQKSSSVVFPYLFKSLRSQVLYFVWLGYFLIISLKYLERILCQYFICQRDSGSCIVFDMSYLKIFIWHLFAMLSW